MSDSKKIVCESAYDYILIDSDGFSPEKLIDDIQQAMLRHPGKSLFLKPEDGLVDLAIYIQREEADEEYRLRKQGESYSSMRAKADRMEMYLQLKKEFDSQ